MRYFLVTYNTMGFKGEIGWGSASIEIEGFIVNKKITKDIAELDKVKNVVIMGIMEFDSKEDYETFIS